MPRDKGIWISGRLYEALWRLRQPGETWEDLLWRLVKREADRS
jgi:hypothetical protein